MSISLSFIRILFLILSIIFSISFTINHLEGGLNLINSAVGLLGGIMIAGMLMAIDFAFKRFNLRSFNTAALGLFCGYLMAQAVLFIFEGAIGQETISTLFPVKFMVYMICAYMGMIMTARSSEEIHACIPYVEFKQMSHKKKDVLVD